MKIFRSLLPDTAQCYISAFVLLLSLFLTLLLSSLLFAVGSHVQGWVFPAAVAVSLLGGHWWLVRKRHSSALQVLRYYVWLLLLYAVAVASAAVIYDNSSDGNMYHQGAVMALLQGWNPFAGSEGIAMLWIKHYAKGLEVIAAAIAACVGRIEAGKAVNLLLTASSFLFTWAFLRRELPALSRARLLWLTALLSLSPVVLRQLYVYYVDYAMYSLLLLTVLSLVQIYRGRAGGAWAVLAMAVLLAPTVKFTVAFYVYLALAVAVVWFFLAHRRTLAYRLALCSVLLVLLGTCGLGYHPYVTNTLGWGNPFYPLLGSSVDIMTSNTPPLYEDGNRFVNFLRSLFYTHDGSAVWIPGVTDSLNDYVIAFDRRIAGFGPLFAFILIGSFFFFFSCRRQVPAAVARQLLLISVLLLAACFCFEQAWWMRYVPFLWAVPVLLVLPSEYVVQLSRRQRIFRRVLYLLMAATMGMAVLSAAVGAVTVTQRFNAICRSVTPRSTVEIYVNSMPSFLYKLDEKNVHYIEIDTTCNADTALRRLPLLQDWVEFYLDEETYSRIRRPDFLDFVSHSKASQ